MRSDKERLADILEAIERIERHAQQGRQAFEENELIQNWFVHHIQIVGEAARKLSDHFRSSHSDIPWSQIIGMRNILVHDYFGVDLDEFWSTIERDLPELKSKLTKIEQETGKNPS